MVVVLVVVVGEGSLREIDDDETAQVGIQSPQHTSRRYVALLAVPVDSCLRS